MDWVAETTEVYCLTVLETRCLRSRCWQDWFLTKAVKETQFQASPLASGGLLAIFGVPWVIEASPHFCLHHHMAFSLCVCLCVQISPFYRYISHIGIGPTGMTYLNYYLSDNPISK